MVFTPFGASVRSTETTTVITDFVLDLNGYTLTGGIPDSDTATGSDISAVVVDGGAKLVINGGAIEGTEYGVYVKNGEATINDVAVSAGTSAVQVYKGTANINGGTFSATKSDVYVVNCIDATWKSGEAKINVYGGTFTNFNPGNNAAEGKGTNFVAAGCISLPQADGSYEVVELAGDIKLESDVVLAAPLHVYEDVVVDLNGKTISIDREGVEKQDYVFAVFEGGNLTINGEGNVSAGEANTSVAVWAFGGDVTINGGYYTNAGEGCDLILADKGSVVTINGGTFKAVERKDGVDGTAEKYSALNCKDNSGSSFVVKGGSYYRFNPGDNKSENPAVSFVADGYEAYAIDADWYGVKAK